MTLHNLTNESKNAIIAGKVLVAKTMFERMQGLLGREALEQNSAMWIKPCGSIHTWFMKFPIDVIFVDKKLKVKALHKNINPWRLVLPTWNAHSVFELNGGSLEKVNVEVGDQLNVGD